MRFRSDVVYGLVLGGGLSKVPSIGRMFAALFWPLSVMAIQQEDLGGARGSVRPLVARASAARARLIRPPDDTMRYRIARGLELYVKTFDRLHDTRSLGRPITFRKENR